MITVYYSIHILEIKNLYLFYCVLCLFGVLLNL